MGGRYTGILNAPVGTPGTFKGEPDSNENLEFEKTLKDMGLEMGLDCSLLVAACGLAASPSKIEGLRTFIVNPPQKRMAMSVELRNDLQALYDKWQSTGTRYK